MMTAPILPLLEALPKARQVRPGAWVACCPAHEDHNPSLSWTTNGDGHVGVKCFADCSAEAIVAALGEPMSALFEPKPTNGHVTINLAKPKAGAVARTRRFQATDTAGRVWTHTRHEDATGRAVGEMKWQSGVRLATLQPYGAEDVPTWPVEDPVLLVEGEATATALRAAGLRVLGTFGVQYKPEPDALAALAGRKVILWPDADDVGRSHMLNMAQRLDGIAEALRWIEPPADVFRGWDAADADAQTVARLVREAGPVPAAATGDPRPTVWTVRQLSELPSAEEESIVSDGILTRGGKLLVYAKSGAGKTTLLDFLAGPLATGRPFLGRFSTDRPRRVLVVQGELSIPEMSSHAQQLMDAGFDDDRLMFTRMIDLRLPKGEEALRALLIEQRAEIVALDPWYRLFSGESSDKPEQVGVVFDVCDRLLTDGLVEAVIVVHHANVTGLRTAGSWMFEGWPSTILRLEAVAGVPAHRIVAFEKIRAPSSSLQGQRLTIALGDDGYLPVLTADQPTEAGVTLAVLIVREAGGQLHRRDLLDRLMVRASCRQRAANKYLGRAVQAGVLRSVRDGAQAVYQAVEGTEE